MAVTGERPSVNNYRRSSSQFTTLPQRSPSVHERAAQSQVDADAKHLYQHPNVRIYKFRPDTEVLKSLNSTKKTLPDADYPIDAIELLSWRSRTEFLEAEGKMIVEKVPGSANFLKAGPSIYTIMRNSQCWCVDGESKFVMRIGILKYLRIEFPSVEPEQKKKIEEWKEVIGTILRYEKTPCPFIRGFQVDLPDDAITPRRRGTWKRNEDMTPITPNTDPSDTRRHKSSRTIDMRGMPPTSFPIRNSTQTEDRPRTASTPISYRKHNFPDTRTESPTTFSSGEEYTDSDRPDSRSDRPESSQHSEEDSDKEVEDVPLLASPLKLVTNASANGGRSRASLPNVKARAATLERRLSQTREPRRPSRDAANIPARQLRDIELDDHDPLFATLLRETRREAPKPLDPRYFPKPGIISGPLNEYEVHKQRSVTMPVQNSTVALKNFDFESTIDPRMDQLTSEAVNGTVPHDSQLQEDQHVDAKVNDSTMESEAVSVEPAQDEKHSKTKDDDAESIISTDSFHTTVSEDFTVDQPMISVQRPSNHRREISELTITASSPGRSEFDDIPGAFYTQHDEQDDRASTPMPPVPQSELRQRLKHRRSLSPMPPSSIIDTPSRQANDHALPKALLRKAATIAVFKPIEAIAFVVHVLARIAQGATMSDLVNGELFRRPGMRRTASGTFEQNVRGRSTLDVEDEDQDEDDYGIPVHIRRKSSVSQSRNRLGRKSSDETSVVSID